MPSYCCPYCDVAITHRPEWAGARVSCSSCGGLYYEPTDPLPGIRPIKAPQQIDDGVPMATLAKAPVLSPATHPVEPIAASAQAMEPKSSHVLRPYESAGHKAIVISWQEGDSRGAKVGTSKNCTKDEGNDMILRVAVKLIKRRWPEIYPLLSVRLDKTIGEGN